jgi:hypothetical protein
MPKPKAASLDASIVLPAKGEARAKSPAKGVEEIIAITVRLNKARYTKLKHYGVDHRQTNQDIMVQALDAFLDANK